MEISHKKVLDKEVKFIDCIKSQSSSKHYFNILCDKRGSTRRARFCDGVSKHSYVIKLPCSWNTIFSC